MHELHHQQHEVCAKGKGIHYSPRQYINYRISSKFCIFGLGLYLMLEVTRYLSTSAGLVPLGGYVSNQIALTKANFTVTCKVALLKKPCSDDELGTISLLSL